MTRIVSLISFIAVVAALGGCGEPTEAPTTRVRRGSLDIVLVESGEISALRSSAVNAPMEWRNDLQIIELVAEGTQVEQGDFLVQFDTAFLEDELAETEASLNTENAARNGAVAKHASEKLRLDNALTTAELSKQQAVLRLEKLRYESEARRQESRLELSKALISLDEANAKLSAQVTLDSLELAKIDLTIADLEARKTQVLRQMKALTLRAPLPGLVIHAEYESNDRRVKARVGENANPGAPVILIPDLSELQVEFAVNEVDRSRIVVGQPVDARLEAFPDVLLEGSIREIARLAVARDGDSAVKGFKVSATLVASNPLVRPGMSVMVSVTLDRLEDVNLVPLAAIYEREGRPVVFPRQSWPDPREVELLRLGDLSAAVGEGVDEGLELALSTPPGDDLTKPLGFARHRQEAGP